MYLNVVDLTLALLATDYLRHRHREVLYVTKPSKVLAVAWDVYGLVSIHSGEKVLFKRVVVHWTVDVHRTNGGVRDIDRLQVGFGLELPLVAAAHILRIALHVM
jgi:hypothetical protein